MRLPRFLLLTSLLAATTVFAAPPIMEFNVRIPMRDGVKLSADVYRPSAPGKYPVVLVRTPYIKGQESVGAEHALWWTERGYAFVIQDVRGRGDSEGDFYPIVHEANDGYDTQTWAGEQPWSSGRVGTIGSSYVAWTQVYTAGLNNPHVGAMVPTVVPADPFRNIPYDHGVLWVTLINWLAFLDGHVAQDLSPVDDVALVKTLPLSTLDRRFGRSIRAWQDWVAHPVLDQYWADQSYQEKYLDSRIPNLHVTGWYDDVLIGTLENYVNLTTRAKDVATRSNQRLIVGPWPHRINQSRRMGKMDFGPGSIIDFRETQARWFDYWLKGIANGVDTEPRVRLFVMGANEWRTENEWPIARTQYVKYFLHSKGKANSVLGDGVLSTETPAGQQQPDRFAYDPGDPVPYITAPGFSQIGGPDDYQQIEHRQDVLVYTAKPFTAPTEICGPLRVKLVAASSARDTDWTAKILDVHPDGTALRLNDGVVRARFRNSDTGADFLTPGKAETYEINAWATCIQMQAGHRLRLEISSSAFPKYAPNLNTGGVAAEETKGIPANQTVFHDKTRLSYLLVPIVPAKP